MSTGPSRPRGGNVVHRIELPRRRWPARGRFALGWPEGAPALPTPTFPATGLVAHPGLVAESAAEPVERREQAAERLRQEALRDVQEAMRDRVRTRPRREAEPAAGTTAGLDPAREAAFQREIEQLERRLKKVNGLLEDREDQLRKLVSSGRVDPGLASLYREVQGIRDDSPMGETKREMMSSIFEANRKLQRRLRELEHGDDPERQGDAGAA